LRNLPQNLIPSHGRDAGAGAFGCDVVGTEPFTRLDWLGRNQRLAGNGLVFCFTQAGALGAISKPFFDIAEMITRFGSTLNWQTLTARVSDMGWQRGVYLALRLAGELAGAEVPVDILERMQPADLTETVLEAARVQIFTDKSFAVSIPAPFAELLESGRLRDRIRIFWQRVFLPRAIIASQYSVPINSARIYLCYPRRFFDVLRRHGRTLKKHQQNDGQLKSLAGRTNLIANWLTQSVTASGSCERQKAGFRSAP